MGGTNITNHLIYPTEGDINGGVPFAGRRQYETTVVETTRNPGGLPGYVISGWTLPSSGSKTQTLTGGTAVIDGYVIKGTGTYAFDFDQNNTDHVFLQLVYTSGKVTGLQVVANTSSTPLANSIKLGTVTVNNASPPTGGQITSSTDQRPQNKRIYGICSNGTINEIGSGGWSISSSTITFTSAFFRKPIIQVTGESGGTVDDSTVVPCVTSANTTTAVLNFGSFTTVHFHACL